MTTPMHLSRRSLLGLAGAGAGALVLGACGKDDGGGKKDDKTIEWWHIGTNSPLREVWDKMAKDFEAENSGVKIKITRIENDAFKSKMTTVVKGGGNIPDMFHTWGGGLLAEQAAAKAVKDISSGVSDILGNFNTGAVDWYQVDGKTYGLPFDLGMVGFWYNKELFAKAGITAPPTTWAEYLDDVKKLKAKKIVPIALAGNEKWPGHYYWAYLAMRVAGLDALAQAGKEKDFNKPEFVEAGKKLKELVDLQPFQKGFLGAKYSTPDGQAALMGNGQAAMELMGQWAPTVEKDSSAKKTGIGDKLGFFPFPAVDGGKGQITDAFGGGNGYTIGKDAPDVAIEFLKFISSIERAKELGASGAVLPVIKDSGSSVTDPNQKLVAETLAKATGFQLYLDQAYPPAVGQQVNDSVAELMAGKATPDQVCKAVTEVFKR